MLLESGNTIPILFTENCWIPNEFNAIENRFSKNKKNKNNYDKKKYEKYVQMLKSYKNKKISEYKIKKIAKIAASKPSKIGLRFIRLHDPKINKDIHRN